MGSKKTGSCPICGSPMEKKEGVLYADGEDVFGCIKPGCGTTAPGSS